MSTQKKLSANVDSDIFDAFEELRKKYGSTTNRSEEVQKALEMRVKHWKKQRLKEQCKEAQEERDFPVEESYEAQAEAFKSKFD